MQLKATIELQSRTELSDVTSIVEQTLAIVAGAVHDFIDGAAYSDIHIDVRVTDEFIQDVERSQRTAAHPYTTERIGGGVAGISQHHDAQEGRHLVFINTSPFASEDFWPRTHLPGVVAHEVAHCLIEHCRAKAGLNGCLKAPQTWDEVIAFTGLAVCDEYLASELGKILLPAVNLNIPELGGAASNRITSAVNRLAGMHDDLSSHVYPAWRDRVLAYRESGERLQEMADELATSINGSLIMSAHYLSAVRDLPQMDELDLVTNHPAMRLYIEPFWAIVRPILDARISGPLWLAFGEADSITREIATDAVSLVWAALGVRFELLEGGDYFIHVTDPLDVDGPGARC